MRKTLLRGSTVLATTLLFASSAYAATSDDIKAMQQEIAQLKQTSESQIQALQAKISGLESKQQQAEKIPAPVAHSIPATPTAKGTSSDSAFNPAVSVVLMGGYNGYSHNPDNTKIAGFANNDDAGLSSRGFSLGESEINLSANVDDMFYGSLTTSLEDEGGDTSIGVEEAFIETLALPYGTKVKAGRFFPVLGYMNEIHAHADSFVDRPLPYRAFLGADNYSEDGVQFSVVLPTALFAELGGGMYSGSSFPAAGSTHNGTGAQSLFGRMGGDVGSSQAWLAGLSYLHTNADNRETDDLTFNGDTSLAIADAKYTWSPNGNPKDKALTLQGEYFWRVEDGDYNTVDYHDKDSNGWYGQAVYKFLPQWKVGYRYSTLNAVGAVTGLEGTSLDNNGHAPRAQSALLEFDNSEFSSIRLQYTHDDEDIKSDDQIFLRYTVTMGAHGAHKY